MSIELFYIKVSIFIDIYTKPFWLQKLESQKTIELATDRAISETTTIDSYCN